MESSEELSREIALSIQVFEFCCEEFFNSKSNDANFTITFSNCKDNSKFMKTSPKGLENAFNLLVTENKLIKVEKRVPTFKINLRSIETLSLLDKFKNESKASELAASQASKNKKTQQTASAPPRIEVVAKSLSQQSKKVGDNALAQQTSNLGQKDRNRERREDVETLKKPKHQTFDSKNTKSLVSSKENEYFPSVRNSSSSASNFSSSASNSSVSAGKAMERDSNLIILYDILNSFQKEMFTLSELLDRVETSVKSTSVLKENLIAYLDLAEEMNKIFLNRDPNPNFFSIDII